jgi:hypothetical protein
VFNKLTNLINAVDTKFIVRVSEVLQADALLRVSKSFENGAEFLIFHAAIIQMNFQNQIVNIFTIPNEFRKSFRIP